MSAATTPTTLDPTFLDDYGHRWLEDWNLHNAEALAALCTEDVECTDPAIGTVHGREAVAGWLRSLARELHDDLGGPGVGALGMCFTGGFALAMMVDTSVVAPVLAQPSVPFAVSPKRSRDLNLSPSDLRVVKERAAAGCQVLGLRFQKDAAVGKRFETLTRELGDAFLKVEFEGREHSTLTEQRQQEGVDRVLAFFDEKLHTPA